MSAPTRTVPASPEVRPLAATDAEQVIAHLTALADQDRVLRFGYQVSDEGLRSYVRQIDFDHDVVFGIAGEAGDLVGVAHLAYPTQDDGSAEFGVSVTPQARGRGLGALLFEHAVAHARHKHVGKLLIHIARDNAAMLAIVRRAGASVSFEGSDALATVPLPQPASAADRSSANATVEADNTRRSPRSRGHGRLRGGSKMATGSSA